MDIKNGGEYDMYTGQNKNLLTLQKWMSSKKQYFDWANNEKALGESLPE